MNLSDVRNIVGWFYGSPMAVELFETMYFDGELKLFHLRMGEGNWESLWKFKKVIGEGSAPLYVIDGVATIPSDLVHLDSGYHRSGGENVDIEFVTDEEWTHLVSHKIDFPTADYPIGNVQPLTIRFRPLEVKFVVLSYITQPVSPTYAVTTTHGFLEFDEANSTTVRWGEDDAILVIQNILQSLNINVTQSEIKQKSKQ